MTRADIDTICANMPGAVLSGPGELDAWKIGGKMFACFGHEETRAANTASVSVKCPDVDTAAMLIDAGVASRAAYFHRSWVSLDIPSLDPGEAQHRLAVSFDTVRGSLPKKARVELAEREGR